MFLLGVRILDDAVTDLREAEGLAHKIMTNHIFSNSWGPSDFGQSVEGPGMLASVSCSHFRHIIYFISP